MRASTLANQANGSTSLSLAVPSKVLMAAARTAPRSELAKSHDERRLPNRRDRQRRSHPARVRVGEWWRLAMVGIIILLALLVWGLVPSVRASLWRRFQQ
jgi:hypothetical protein